MDPSAWHNLLLNLKLQLLGLPNLARWGLLTFAGILILREAITLGWNAYKRPALENPEPAAPAALPAPDPFAASHQPQQEPEGIRVRTPPAGLGRH